MPPTPDEMLSAVSDSLAARTGRSLDQWLALVRSCGVDPLDQTALRPIYDALATVIGRLGDDVTVEGRGTYTPFVRGRQFAATAAAARDRVDLGLRFSDPPQADRLQPGGGPGQATHQVSLRDVGEVDAEIVRLLRVAYEQHA